MCPACGRHDPYAVVELNEKSRARFDAFSAIKYGGLMRTWPQRLQIAIDHCNGCGHCWYRFQPTADDLAQMYAAARPLHGDGAAPAREPTAAMRHEMRRIRRLVPAAQTLLDYGSGFGRWARAAALEGFSVTAYEPAVSRGAEAAAIEFEVVADIEQLVGRQFDVINVEQVLEHVPDPAAELRRITMFCGPHTWIRVTVPNILRPPEGSLLWDVWPYDGKRAHIMAPFEHLHGFTPASLRALVERAGLRAVPGWKILHAFPMRGLRDCARFWIPCVDQTFVLLRVPSHSR